MKVARGPKAASVATALTALLVLLSFGCGQPPAHSRYTGHIKNRVRIVQIELDRAGFHPDHILVAQGEDVRLVATSKDTAHTLAIDFYKVEMRLGPGQTEKVMVAAGYPGEHRMVCTSGEPGTVSEGLFVVMPRPAILRWLARYGLSVLFVALLFGIAGIPMPDEVILSFAGGLASTGDYNMGYLATVLVAFLGAACGITFSYVLGRTAGLGVVHRWGKLLHITDERLSGVHHWFAHGRGRWALMSCIYLPVLRHITAIVAGTSRMPVWEFALCAYTGVLAWAGTFVTLGFLAADHWMRMSRRVHSILLGVTTVASAIVFAWLIIRIRRGRRRQVPEAARQKP